MKKILLFLVIFVVLGSAYFVWRETFVISEPQVVQVSKSVDAILEETDDQESDKKTEVSDQEQQETDEPQPEEQDQESLPKQTDSPDRDTEEIRVIASEVLLEVPFIVQAPFANWELPYKEACEEASVMMVHNYYEGNSITSQEEMKSEIDAIIGWGGETFGMFDTTTAQTARYFTEKLGYEEERVHVVYDMTIQDIKALLDQNIPVIVPAAGRELGNIYFQNPGPLYHMLVITGYKGDEFITQDPGTRRGEGYRYNQTVLYNAIHDLTPDLEDINSGGKVMLVVRP
jgi:hypothetical protein